MNYYEILEVSQNASQEVIKAAYKSLMQRYHPDRNPGNAGVAEHASQVIVAYKVLSDPGERAAYDARLKQQITDNLMIDRAMHRNISVPSVPVDKDSKSEWISWLLIILVLGSVWLFMSPSKDSRSPSTQEQKQSYVKRLDDLIRGKPESRKQDENVRAKDLAARTIPVFIENLNINLRVPNKRPGTSGNAQEDSRSATDGSGKPSESTDNIPVETAISLVDSGHVLFIPSLGTIAGTFDPDKVIQYLDNHRELISQHLSEKLADAKYDELVRIDGERYLKEMILDSIGEATGTDRHDEYPSVNGSEPAHYGVVEVLLPESFTVR
jgi:hypothetical protein